MAEGGRERVMGKREIIYRRGVWTDQRQKKGSGQMSDEKRKRWADIGRIYQTVISWHFVSFM